MERLHPQLIDEARDSAPGRGGVVRWLWLPLVRRHIVTGVSRREIKGVLPTPPDTERQPRSPKIHAPA